MVEFLLKLQGKWAKGRKNKMRGKFAYHAISRISSTISQLDTIIFFIIHTHTRASHTLCRNPHAHTHEPTYAHTR